MNRGEEKETRPKDSQKGEEQFAAANTVSTVEEDNKRRPLDKIEGNMQNGETGGNVKEENPKK